MRLAGKLGDFRPVIGEEAQRAARGDGRIELAQGTGGRVARIGEDLLARLLLALVERGEIGVAHIDLAAHLEDLGRILAAEASSARP